MPKAVLIQFSLVGVIYRFFQISIIAYFIGWVIVKEKGYQSYDRPIYGVSAKVRGTSVGKVEQYRRYLAAGPVVYTDADLVQPPIQNSGFFLGTRVLNSVDQLQSTCAEASDLLDARCQTESQCPLGKNAGNRVPDELAYLTNSSWFDVENHGHGPFTGKCLSKTMTCEVFAWCPILRNNKLQGFSRSSPFVSNLNEWTYSTEPARIPIKNVDDTYASWKTAPLYEVLNFTVLIRNSIEFPLYKIKRNNILDWMDNTYLQTCHFNASDEVDRQCPRFRIHDIISESGANVGHILLNGGIIDININWDCDLNKELDKCLPVYSFRYLGALTGATSSGRELDPMEEKFSLEFANYFASSQLRRILHKFNGIQFLISVTGRGGRFSLLEFSMKIGSCMALFGTATLFCNLILVNFSCDRHRYKQTVCRLSPLAGGKGLIKRLHASRSPPKPALRKPEKLNALIELYASRVGVRTMPGVKINVKEEGGNCVASVSEEDRYCPSLIGGRFISVNFSMEEPDSVEVRQSNYFDPVNPTYVMNAVIE